MNRRNLNFDDFLWIPIASFKTIGINVLQAPGSRWSKAFSNVLLTFAIFSHIFCFFYLLQQFPALDFRHNMLPIMTTASSVAFAINGNIKFLAFLANRKCVHEIYDFFKQIYPTTCTERRNYRVERYYYSKQELAVVVTFFGSCWVLLMVPLLLSVGKFMHDVLLYGYVESSFLYSKYYATDYVINHRQPLGYLLVYLIEMASSHYLILTNVGTDLLLIPFAAQVRMHLDRLSEDLENLKPNSKNGKSDCMALREIMQKHKEIMDVPAKLKSSFEISMAFNVISTIGVICTVAVRVAFIGLKPDFFLYGVYLTSAVFEFYIVCQHGQQLSDASEKVASAAYNSSWYNASEEYKKMLLILMIRASRPANLDVVGGPPISMDTFKIVLTVSYRNFAIFHSMKE